MRTQQWYHQIIALWYVGACQCLPEITFFNSAGVFGEISKTKGQPIDRKMDGGERRIFQITLNG